MISCRVLTEGRTALHWAAPAKLGDPPVHKYVIESREVDTNGALWTLAAEIDSHISQTQYTYVLDHANTRPQFRIVAWTLYGPSLHSHFDFCDIPQSLSTSHSALPAAESQGVSRMTSFAEVATRGVKAEKQESERRGFWSLFVIAVMIGLRVLTRRNVAILKCCALYQLERLASSARLKSLSKWIHEVKRVECAQCKARCQKHSEIQEAKEKLQHQPLTRTHAFSHKIEPGQHFKVDESRMVFSHSSHALGDHKTDYNLTAWNPKEAKEAVENLPLPEYPLNAWEDKSERLSSTSSNLSDVQSQLIEGQCAHEG